MSDDHTKNSRASRKRFEDNAEETALKPPARGASTKESATRGGMGAVPHHDSATESPFEEGDELEACRLRLEMQALGAAKTHLGAPEPYLVKATVTKETKETDMGIKFSMLENGIVVISDISKSGLFRDTALKVGYDLVSINGISCTGGFPEDCADVILREVEGRVTIVAKLFPPTLVATTVVKESARNTKMGIKFCDSEDGKNVMISHISKTGLFKDTTLQVGYTVLSINNVFCAGMTRKEIKSMVHEAEGFITIVACHDRNMGFAGKVPFSGVGELEAHRRLKAKVHDKEASKKCIGVIEEVVTEPSIPLRVTNRLSPQETPIVTEDNTEEGEENEGVVECTQVGQAASLPLPSLQQGQRVSNHGAFAVHGQTVERRTNSYVSPTTEQGQMVSQSVSAGESANEVTQASDDASSQVPIAAEVAPESDLEVLLERQLQRAISRAVVPAETVTPMTGRKLWKRPAVLVVMAVFFLVAIAVAVTSLVLSLGNGESSDPPPTPPPSLSDVGVGIACESAVGPVPANGSVTIGSNQNGTIPYSSASCGNNVTAFGMWYKFIGTGSRLTASTCSNITDFDTQLAVFAGTCENLVCIDSNNDACALQSAVHWDSTDGETYFVFVSGHDRATGTFGLSFGRGIACESAMGPLPVNGSITIGSNLDRATTSGTAASCGGTNITASGIWYTVNGTGGRLAASTHSDVTDFDAQISVFAGTCGNLVCVDCNDVSCPTYLQSAVSWNSTAGELYFVLVHGNVSATGAFGLTILSFGSWQQLGQDLQGEATRDAFGWSVSLSNDGYILAAGSVLNDNGNGEDAGNVRAFRYDSAVLRWSQIGQDIEGKARGDELGGHVSLNGAGDTLAVGARGYVQVFQYDSATPRNWTQKGQHLYDEAAGAELGMSASLSNSGDILAVGGKHNNSGSGELTGRVRVLRFNHSTLTWSQLGQEIDGKSEKFGRSLSLNSAGDILAVGGNEASTANGDFLAHVQVYQYNSSMQEWTQMGLDIDGAAAGDEFGRSLSLSNDGSILAVGAHLTTNGNGSPGHVRVFQYNSNTLIWLQLGQDIDGEGRNDRFGYSVSLNGGGNVLAAGGVRNNNNGDDSGHVRVFQYDTTILTWTRVGQAIEGDRGDRSGSAVSLSEDGNIVGVGGPRSKANGARSGRTRVYALD